MSAHATLRLHTLLAWAVEFVERETGVTVHSFMDQRVDIADCRRWLAEAREALGREPSGDYTDSIDVPESFATGEFSDGN